MALFKRKIFWIVLSLTIFGAALRLYKLPETLQFLGDQGRDALRVARIFKQGDLVFIGPVTSIGNMYLGPLYYYFMLPWLWLSYPSPLGPAYAVATLSIITISLLYLLGQELVGKKAALFATVCITFSSVVITYSRFSWNPNPAPLFGLLLLWALYRAWKNSPRYWMLVAVIFSVLIQLHYMTLLSIFPILIVLSLEIQNRIRSKKKIKELFKYVILSALIGVAFISPLVVFDSKHGGTNLLALTQLLGGENSISSSNAEHTLGKVWTIIEETHGRSMQLLFDMYIGQVRDRSLCSLCSTSRAIDVWHVGELYLQARKNRRGGSFVRIVFVYCKKPAELAL